MKEKWYDVTVTKKIVVGKAIKARSENDARKKYDTWPMGNDNDDLKNAIELCGGYIASTSNPFVRAEINDSSSIKALDSELAKLRGKPKVFERNDGPGDSK